MSTAKSMANQYLSAKRASAASKSGTLSPLASSQQHRFKSSTSNLVSNSISGRSKITSVGLKATSMTNLASENNSSPAAARLQRPASRNALDSIHNGMNAKYAQVQSKVLLQNIRPQQQQSKIPATKGDTLTRRSNVPLRSSPSPTKAPPNERSATISKLKSIQEELDRNEQEREALKQELERERADKLEQLQQIKLELQEKVAEHEKQNEEYHQKLLEAYELADQNRRAADQVLGESRQRTEESRKKIEELETQLSELKEFVTMKEEMTDKMYELKEQIREERQRYEEQLKSLHQVFENEKIRLEKDLMEKVRQVGEHYELNKYKTLNKTIELDARLANERLLATKVRLNQVSSANDKLMKQLRSLQQDFRGQEKKLLLTETMLRQLIDTKDSAGSPRRFAQQQPKATGSRVGRAAGRLSKFGRSQTTTTTTAAVATPSAAANRTRPPAVGNNDLVQMRPLIMQASGQASSELTSEQVNGGGGSGSSNSTATQTQTAPSRTRTIINDLRQRLNLAGNSSKAWSSRQQQLDNGTSPADIDEDSLATGQQQQPDEALYKTSRTQTPSLIGDDQLGQRRMTNTNTEREVHLKRQTNNLEHWDYLDDDQYIYYDDYDLDDELRDKKGNHYLLEVKAGSGRRRSVSLNDILAGSFVHEAPTGEQIIVSRGWPLPRAGPRRPKSSSGVRHPQVRLRSRLNEAQKRKLLMQFLARQPTKQRAPVVQSRTSDVEAALRLPATGKHAGVNHAGRRASILRLNVRRVGLPTRGVHTRPGDERLAGKKQQQQQQLAQKINVKGKANAKRLTVQYDLPTASDGMQPIALGQQKQ